MNKNYIEIPNNERSIENRQAHPIWYNHLRKTLYLIIWHRWLGYLNVKNVHTLQSMLSVMNLDKIPCSMSLLISSLHALSKNNMV